MLWDSPLAVWYVLVAAAFFQSCINPHECQYLTIGQLSLLLSAKQVANSKWEIRNLYWYQQKRFLLFRSNSDWFTGWEKKSWRTRFSGMVWWCFAVRKWKMVKTLWNFNCFKGQKYLLIQKPARNKKTCSLNKLDGYYLNKRQKSLSVYLCIQVHPLQNTKKI